MFLGLALVACEEDEKEEQQNQPVPAPNSTTPQVGSNVDAVMVALNVAVSFEVPNFPPQTVFQGIPFAQILDNTSAGTVSCEGGALASFGGGSYTFSLDPTDTDGLSFDRPIEWEATGGSTVGAFTYSHDATAPRIADVMGDNDGVVDLSDDVTISYNTSQSSLGSADSLYFVIYDRTGNNIIKKTGRNTTAVTFMAGEISDLVSGAGSIQVNAFTYEVENAGGATIAVIAQGSATKNVELQ